MRIGVLTHSAGDDNYGQILQCYALQQYLKQIGQQPFLIQHKVDDTPAPETMALLKKLLRLVLELVSPRHKKIYDELRAIKKQRDLNSVRNKVRDFQKFKSENIELSKFYGRCEDLLSNPPKADVYIVGSDQVWNLSVNSNNALAWYLQFGSKDIKRISYAASIGRQLDESEYEQFRAFLEGFTAVSVRDTTSLECCKKAGVMNAQMVLDPTMLVTQNVYMPFVQKEYLGKPYLFLYYLNVINKEDLAWNQIELFLKDNDIELKCVSSSGYYPAFDLIPGHDNLLLTIPEWLNAIYYSDYVVTTSFHGIAISIMMHKPFVAILLKGMYSGGNGRITSLLSSLGLSVRILTADKTISEILKMQIDWTSVDKLLAEQREQSEQFLQEALKI